MTTACEAHALAISSSATTYETVSAPAPPHCSGTMIPSRPSSPMRLTVSCGKRASRSISEAMGATCSWANSAAIARIICCSDVSSIRMIPSGSPRTAEARSQARLALRLRLALRPRDVLRLALRFIQQSLEFLGQRRDHLEEVGHDAVIGDLEDRRLRVLVDGDDDLRGAHAGQVLDGARDAEAEVELGRDRAAGLADLEAVRPPAGVHRGARGADGGADHLAHVLQNYVVLGAFHAAPTGDDDFGLGQLGQAGRDLLAPLDQLHPRGGDLHARLLHLRALARPALGGPLNARGPGGGAPRPSPPPLFGQPSRVKGGRRPQRLGPPRPGPPRRREPRA